MPVLLNLRDERVLVVGGGLVGARKAQNARSADARVVVVDPQPGLSLPPGCEHVVERYRPEHLAGASLAFACATTDVNAQIVQDARARGVWVNAATSPDEGDFALPAVVRRGGLTLAVSTGGASPALARRIREKLEAEFDEAFGLWVQVLAEVRAEVLASVPDDARRRALLDGFAGWEWLARLRDEGAEAVRSAMRSAMRAEVGRRR
ncbi:MAG: bifunctional precorrin-2 dehydrogenase/sirohydrochlorin ferrochelatase [Gemmataceae bacterium]|nr:bifunctional precorrin-2 dehydrogenase/sirohydrochlorin ferrochelatase [Gemmataceae bacterium]